jgi:hypothetical protein
LEWLLRFSQKDIAAQSDAEMTEAFEVLSFVQTRLMPHAPATERELSEVRRTHDLLRRLFEEMAHGRSFGFDAPETYWSFSPPPKRAPGSRTSDRITRLNDMRLMRQQMSPSAVFRTIDLLDAMGADRLTACPLEEGDGPCGKIFLAQGRQKFCTPQHAQKAAFQAYRARGGDVARKLARR